MRHEDRVADTHEVFTPRSLVRDMLSRLPNHVWFDPCKTWLEPAAGDGNFLVEIKARLLQAGHPERHVLNHQLFSIELMDDNHYVLQLRLGYLREEDGYLVPGPALQDDLHLFRVSKINLLTQDLNHLSPYAGKTVLIDGEPYTLQPDEVYHHVNHRCASALDGIEFPGVDGLKETPPLSFSIDDFSDEEQAAILHEAEKLALKLTDKPHLPPRTLEEKVQSCIIGLPAERWLAKHGLSRNDLQADEQPTYKDLRGEGFRLREFNGDLEVKTINRPTLEAAEKARSHSRSGKSRFMWIFHCNHSSLSYAPFCVFEAGIEQPVLRWRSAHVLDDWPDTDTPEIGQKTVVSIYRDRGTWYVRKKVEVPTERPILKSLAKDGKNPTRPLPVPKPKVVKTPTPKPEKVQQPPKLDSKGGGWQVKAEWIGQGKKVRCKSPFDGSFWECDHDQLVEAINASLKAKGKPLIGEPGPSEKSYGASSGLREQHLWTRV